MTITQEVSTEVADFASAVRSKLLDLDVETIDDLTDGLEADLADKLADGQPLGDPVAYAEELRAAAGVEPRRQPSIVRNVRDNLADLRARLAPIASNRAIAAVLSFLVALRPLWWVIRAWGLFYLLAGFKALPSNEWDYPVLAALLLLSIQWGRGRWLPWKWSRGAVIALSVVALLAVPTLTMYMVDKVTFADRMDPADYVPGGVLNNGSTVTNIFAYGADGKPLRDVQLFDQNGNPLNIVSGDWGQATSYDDTLGYEQVLVPSDAVSSDSGWNVFPLSSVATSDLDDSGNVPSWAKRTAPDGPFVAVQPMLGYTSPEEAAN